VCGRRPHQSPARVIRYGQGSHRWFTQGRHQKIVGKALGDAKPQADGKSDKAEGKAQPLAA